MGIKFLDDVNSNLCILLCNVDFSIYTDDELIQILDEMNQRNEFFQLENKIFEAYYARTNVSNTTSHVGSKSPSTLIEDEKNKPSHSDTIPPKQGSETNEITIAIESTQSPSMASRGKKKKGEKNKQVSEVIVLLSPEQKSEIATRELEEFKDEVEKEKTEWTRIIDNLKAEMEELEINASELKKDLLEFNRDIVEGSRSPRTGKVMAEKVVRYLEDKIRNRDTMLGKIRLKNSTLKTQKNKLVLQLKQKEEMGEVLHAIDFDQLKIENHQYLAKIEERNSELLKLKMAAGNIVQVMNVFKKKLNDLSEESSHLRNEIQQRKELLEKLRSDGKNVEKEIEKALQVHQEIVKAGQEFRVPSVMEYVLLKARQQNLQQQHRAWKRKLEIAQMAFGRASCKLPTLNRANPSSPLRLSSPTSPKDLQTLIQAKSSIPEDRARSSHSQKPFTELIQV